MARKKLEKEFLSIKEGFVKQDVYKKNLKNLNKSLSKQQKGLKTQITKKIHK